MLKSFAMLSLKVAGFLLILSVPILLGQNQDSIYANHDTHDKDPEPTQLIEAAQAAPIKEAPKTLPTETLTAMLLTVKELSLKEQFEDAIAVLKGIPESHHQQPEVVNTKNEFAQRLLEVGQLSYDQGDSDRAIAMLQMVPEGTNVHAESRATLADWRDRVVTE